MNAAPTHAGQTPADHGPSGHAHAPAADGTLAHYLIGFGLSVLLTAVPFFLVMSGALPAQITGFTVIGFAAAQIVVHMMFFLHMNAKTEEGWTMLSTLFTAIIVVIAIGGSLWVMHHLNTNMMPVHDMDMR